MEKTLTTHSSDIFLPFRIINHGPKVSRSLERFSLNGTSRDQLMDSARKKTGLDDFGDLSFIPDLDHLLRSSCTDRFMSLTERLLFQSRLMIHLKNRLRIQKELSQHPSIRYEPIDKPLFIVGMQRTGTTFLQKLLAKDPYNRIVLDWESNPAPLPEESYFKNDIRIRHAHLKHRMFHYLSPQLPVIHPGSARGPLECLPLLMNAFVFNTVPGFCEFRSYVTWARRQDRRPAYRYYRRQLQILQYQRPKTRWVLKAPMHLEHLGTLADIFSDARIIHLHRSPYEAIPSGCSLYATYLNMFRSYPDFHHLGKEYMDMWHYALSKSLDARRGISGERLINVSYSRLVENPVDTVKHIYAHFGMPFSSAFEQGIRELLLTKKSGRHRYSLDQFHLTPKMIHDKFSDYIHRFNITV